MNNLSGDEKVYFTDLGCQYSMDSYDMLTKMPSGSVDLIMTSPPFALLRKKTYGNEDQDVYVEWLLRFGAEAKRVLKDTGSFVIDLGGAYQKGKPIRSLYNYRVLIAFCDKLDYNLAEEFFWHNPSKLPSPIEWVNKRKIRVKDSVNTIWWFSKSDFPKADVRNVLQPYSDRMKKLLKNPEKYYTPAQRPSGHSIGKGFGTDNGGSIPPNLLQISNSESGSHYLSAIKAIGRKRHPARFPSDLPKFFIEFLTEKGDVVLDIFSGSNTTGHVAETLDRRWISCDIDRDYAVLSSVRFMEGVDNETINNAILSMEDGECLNISDIEPPVYQLDLIKPN